MHQNGVKALQWRIPSFSGVFAQTKILIIKSVDVKSGGLDLDKNYYQCCGITMVVLFV